MASLLQLCLFDCESPPFSSLFPSHSMASRLALQPTVFYDSKFVQLRDRMTASSNTTGPSNTMIITDQEKHRLAKSFMSQGLLSMFGTSPTQAPSLKLMPLGALSSMGSAAESDQISDEDKLSVPTSVTQREEFNRVNCLVWLLHESARSFSLAVQAHELTRTGPELAMAWIGMDVHVWHKNIAYQVAIYALLKAAIEVERFLSHKRCSNPSHVHEILSQKAQLLCERIEFQLNKQNPQLMQWFRMVELPRIAGLFIPLFKKWSMDYAGSGVAGVVLAISCCAAVKKLCAGRNSSPLFPFSIEDALVELMTLSHNLVSVDKFHQLASDAGFEEDFLLHFGRKIFPCSNMEDLEFWIGLVQKKLSAAFHRESVIIDKQIFHDKVQGNSLATLGLFAYLGQETRLFLSGMGIKDVDEQTTDFLSYLECGSILIYPEFSTLSEYQLFLEVVTDEIGWLHFYPAFKGGEACQDRRRSKSHTIQAEKEIILYNVLTVCYDVISGFAHYSNSTQQPIDSKLLEFLLQSQSLLSTCMEDYWAAYDDKTCELQKIMERSDPSPSSITAQTSYDSTGRGNDQCESRLAKAISSAGENKGTVEELDCATAPDPLDENILKRSSRILISASVDAWTGTQILFIDILEAVGLLAKQVRGCKVTKREKKKIRRTFADFASLVPIIILMLLPVSAVGHAAILAAIKKYMPFMIPSPYTWERLGLLKQFKRIKERELQQRKSIQDASSRMVDESQF